MRISTVPHKASCTWRRRLIVLLVATIAVSGCRQSWESPGFTGAVVDDETGAPIADAVLVASWALEVGGVLAEVVAVQEVVSERDGSFAFSPWGPEVRWSSDLEMFVTEPYLRVLARGYCPAILTNKSGDSLSPLHGNVAPKGLPNPIRLTPMGSAPDSCSVQYAGTAQSLMFAYIGSPRCYWTQLPRTILALDEAAKRGHFDTGWVGLGSIELITAAPECPRPEEFLRAYTNQ